MKLKIGDGIRSLRDGALIQAGMVTYLSFSHLHDVAVMVGQSGASGWVYPPSVDLLMYSSYRRIKIARRTGASKKAAVTAFILASAASLSANVIALLPHAMQAAIAASLTTQVVVGAWPPVALVVSILLGHTAETSAVKVVESAEAPAPVAAAATASVPVAAPQVPAQAPAVVLPTEPIKTKKQVLAFLDQHPNLRALNPSDMFRKIEEICAAARVDAPSQSTVYRAATGS